jgi:hypothetical protein
MALVDHNQIEETRREPPVELLALLRAGDRLIEAEIDFEGRVDAPLPVEREGEIAADIEIKDLLKNAPHLIKDVNDKEALKNTPMQIQSLQQSVDRLQIQTSNIQKQVHTIPGVKP